MGWLVFLEEKDPREGSFSDGLPSLIQVCDKLVTLKVVIHAMLFSARQQTPVRTDSCLCVFLTCSLDHIEVKFQGRLLHFL